MSKDAALRKLRGMDSIRQSQFQPISRRQDSQGVSRFQQDDSQQEQCSQDSYFESLAPVEELDDEEEKEEGERHEQELLEKHALWEDEDAFLLLEDIYAKLQSFMLRSELEYEFLALDAPTPFASSCPNGAIYFTRALLEALSPEEILFFAAHELAHTELRHYASRKRRLGDLRQVIPAPIGSPTRQRMDLAAVLVVRHQEEFEADHQAGKWVSSALGVQALSALHHLCRQLSPESLQRPTHPPFEKRVHHLRRQIPFPEPLDYLYTLLP